MIQQKMFNIQHISNVNKFACALSNITFEKFFIKNQNKEKHTCEKQIFKIDLMLSIQF